MAECSVDTEDCVCGECVGVDDGDGTDTCGFVEDKGSNKPGDICFKAVESPSSCDPSSILEAEFSPPGTNGCRGIFRYGADPRCLDGWLVSTQQFPLCDSNRASNNISIYSECAGEASIHTSCSCPIGMCYQFGNYQITGYTLYGDTDTTFYQDDNCPSPAPTVDPICPS